MAKILLVDDSKFSRYMLAKILISGAHEVIEAVNGEDGLAKAQTDTPDLIITDLLMPGLDGIGLVNRLKECGIGTPVVVVTANIQDTMHQRCMELGVKGFVNKPVKPDELLTLINQLQA